MTAGHALLPEGYVPPILNVPMCGPGDSVTVLSVVYEESK